MSPQNQMNVATLSLSFNWCCKIASSLVVSGMYLLEKGLSKLYSLLFGHGFVSWLHHKMLL